MNSKKITLHNETPNDYKKSEEVTREAFWNHYSPACDEHYLLHIMRTADAFIQELSFVAKADDEVVGNIAYTKAKIEGDDGSSQEVLTFGPLSVHPNFQGMGIGKQLVEHSKKIAKELGYKAILIYGDPAIYSRFGFVPAENFKIGSSDNMYAVALLAIELQTGALSQLSGRFIEDAVYDLDETAAKEFDKNFSHKHLIDDSPSQKRFQQLIQMRRKRE